MARHERAPLKAIVLLIAGMIVGLITMRGLGYGGFLPVLLFGGTGIFVGNQVYWLFQRARG
jgi:hypothetical protein